MAETLTLTPPQCRLADAMVDFICCGEYCAALDTLDSSEGTLPTWQEQAMRQLLQRLEETHQFNTLQACKPLIQQLKLNRSHINVVTNMNFSLPNQVLGEIYEQLLRLRFSDFHKQLAYIEYVEKAIMSHKLKVCAHCLRTGDVQRAIDRLTELQTKLSILIGMLFVVGVYLILLTIWQ